MLLTRGFVVEVRAVPLGVSGSPLPLFRQPLDFGGERRCALAERGVYGTSLRRATAQCVRRFACFKEPALREREPVVGRPLGASEPFN